MSKSLLPAFLIGLGFLLPAQAAEPDRLQMDAYTATIQADEARDAEDWGVAVSAYQDALIAYRRLAAEHQDWQPGVVAHRIQYCETELDRLEGRSALPVPTASSRRAGPESTVEHVRIQALNRESDYQQQRINELDAELEQSRQDSFTQTERLDALTRENQSLRESLREARNKLDAVDFDKDSYRDLQAHAGRLKSQLRGATDQLKDRTDQLAEGVKWQEAYHAAQEEMAAQQAQIRQLELALKGAEREGELRSQQDEERGLLEAKCRLLRREVDDALSSSHDLEGRLHTLTLEHETLQDAYDEARRALAASLNEMQDYVAHAESSDPGAAEDDDATDSLVAELEAMEEEASELRDARISAEARAAKAERQILELTADRDPRGSADAPVEDPRTVSALQRQLKQLRAAYDDVTGRFEQQSAELQEALAALDDRRPEQETVAALRRTIADLREEYAAMGTAVDAASDLSTDANAPPVAGQPEPVTLPP